MGASGGPKIVKDDLKVYLYAVDNTSYPGSGTTWKYLSGNGYDATLSAAGIGTVSSSLNTMAFKSGDADFAEVADIEWGKQNQIKGIVFLFDTVPFHVTKDTDFNELASN